MLLIEGYGFYKQRDCTNKENVTKTRWFCGSHHAKGCKAAVFTIDNHIVRFSQPVDKECRLPQQIAKSGGGGRVDSSMPSLHHLVLLVSQSIDKECRLPQQISESEGGGAGVDSSKPAPRPSVLLVSQPVNTKCSLTQRTADSANDSRVDSATPAFCQSTLSVSQPVNTKCSSTQRTADSGSGGRVDSATPAFCQSTLSVSQPVNTKCLLTQRNADSGSGYVDSLKKPAPQKSEVPGADSDPDSDADLDYSCVRTSREYVDAKFVRMKSGGECLLYDGFKFYVNPNYKGKLVRWACSKGRDKDCKAAVFLSRTDSRVFRYHKYHTHDLCEDYMLGTKSPDLPSRPLWPTRERCRPV
ncbi:serine/arginine repetitive matrix protein 2-like [Maniola hyperantus]|uniref:serine/arginine repetitive matrix protein 2-like n=1 Tax=Aphantopus hyperantus TaxID=2795564 RepID=UPI0037481500